MQMQQMFSRKGDLVLVYVTFRRQGQCTPECIREGSMACGRTMPEFSDAMRGSCAHARVLI